MNPILWTVTVEEANYILAALGARPFGEVANLIGKLKAAAEQQIAQAAQGAPVVQTEAPAVN